MTTIDRTPGETVQIVVTIPTIKSVKEKMKAKMVDAKRDRLTKKLEKIEKNISDLPN